MTSMSALVKSMFISLGRGIPALSTSAGHKPAQLSTVGGEVTAELLPEAHFPTPFSLGTKSSLHQHKALWTGFVPWDTAGPQSICHLLLPAAAGA